MIWLHVAASRSKIRSWIQPWDTQCTVQVEYGIFATWGNHWCRPLIQLWIWYRLSKWCWKRNNCVLSVCVLKIWSRKGREWIYASGGRIGIETVAFIWFADWHVHTCWTSAEKRLKERRNNVTLYWWLHFCMYETRVTKKS